MDDLVRIYREAGCVVRLTHNKAIGVQIATKNQEYANKLRLKFGCKAGLSRGHHVCSIGKLGALQEYLLAIVESGFGGEKWRKARVWLKFVSGQINFDDASDEVQAMKVKRVTDSYSEKCEKALRVQARGEKLE